MTSPATLPRERVVSARTAVFVVFALAGVAFAPGRRGSRTPRRPSTSVRASSARRSSRCRPAPCSPCRRPGASPRGSGRRHDPDRHGHRCRRVRDRRRRGRPRRVPPRRRRRPLPHRQRHRGVGRRHEPRGRRRRAAPRADGHAAVPRRLQRRDRRVRARRRGHVLGRGAPPAAPARLGAARHRRGLLGHAPFLPRDTEEAETEAAADPTTGARLGPARTRRRHPRASRSAWLEPRTLLIGLVTLVAAFTEGTANDWLAVAFVEGHDLPAWAGVLGFATFLSFMTIGRLLGTRWLDTYGRVPVLRATFALAVLGSVLVIFGAPGWPSSVQRSGASASRSASPWA